MGAVRDLEERMHRSRSLALPLPPPGLRIRALILLGALAWLAGLDAAPAHAHGGNFGPPPNPQAKGPPRGGGPPAYVDPGFGGPIVTPGGGGDVTPRNPGSKRKTAITPTHETSWRLWWELNREALLAPRHAGRLPVVTGAPDGGAAPPPAAPPLTSRLQPCVPASSFAAASAAVHALAFVAVAHAVPFVDVVFRMAGAAPASAPPSSPASFGAFGLSKVCTRSST